MTVASGTSTFDPTTGTGGCTFPRIAGGSTGHRKWSMKRGRDGNREYTLKYRVEVDPSQGPFAALYAPGLPYPGAVWNFGDAEHDTAAMCTQEASVDQVMGEDDGPNKFFDLTYVFSTALADTCFTQWVDDPVLRPAKTSGNFVRYSEEATYDRFGDPILSSSWERITGPKVEFDANRPQIHIELYTTSLDLATLCAYIDGVNEFPLWGFNERCVKFSACSWRKLYKADCSYMHHKVMEFDVNTATFDRNVLDEGTKVLFGEWDRTKGHWKLNPVGRDATTGEWIWPDPSNPTHFMRYYDQNHNVTRVILNGFGVPWNPAHYTSGTATASYGTSDDEKGQIPIQKYPSVDLTLLGIPLSL